MRIFDTNNIELKDPDLSRGYLQEEKIFLRRHEAIEAIDEQWHYEVVKTYPNGGKDIKKVIDVAGVEAKAAWDEYEDIYRYIEYKEEDLNIDKETPNLNQRLSKIEEALSKLE
jgi:hypothetical protein